MKSSGSIRIGSIVLVANLVLLAVNFSGCKTDKITNPAPNPPKGPTTSLETPPEVQVPDIPIAGRTEVDLVEEMMLHRAMYARYLDRLTTYYSENGYPEKAAWAQTELKGLRKVPTYKYLLEAEVPRAEVAPEESVAEADHLFKEGIDLMHKGGWRRTPGLYNQTTMRMARAKFEELVNRYPNSDKADDAAYYIAEIHGEYEHERNNTLAIEWYKRAIEMNPDTPHPCRFRIAEFYDYRLHEREKALHWYQEALDKESKFDGQKGFEVNKKFAQGRIRELTPDEHRLAPGEAVADGRPAPTGSPEPTEEPMETTPAPRKTR